jgi:cholest-4-en-3-one 26-monooxygenase
MRTAAVDMTLGGKEVKAGDLVVVWNLSANRDPRAFRNADQFDCQRRPNQHLGFALGKHFCLGAHLARLEMRVMLGYLLEHMQEIELNGKVERSASNLFPGIKHMPIRFKPAAMISPLNSQLNGGA